MDAEQRHVKINMIDLELAFSGTGDSFHYYLDLQSGEVILVTDDMRMDISDMDELIGEAGAPELTIEEAAETIDGWSGAPAEDLVAAYRAEVLGDERYVAVPERESSDEYRQMEDLVETVRDSVLRERLAVALQGKRPFRHFKDVLAWHETERQRWFKLRDKRVRDQALEWLDELNIELS